MTNIIPSVKTFNGRAIKINPETRYVCLTDMAKASGKMLGHWNQLQQTTVYIEALESIIGIPIMELITSQVGGDHSGTWAHPQIAIKFAAWCSPEFEVQTTMWLDELLTTGKVELVSTKELTRREILNIAIAAEDRAEALAAQIEADSEKTALGAIITESSTKGIRIGEFAKTIGMGQNKYFEELRDCGIICQTSTLPYQKYLSAKYFVVTQVCHNGKWYPVALVTTKGQAYLAKRHQQWIERETVVRLIEAEVSAIV